MSPRSIEERFRLVASTADELGRHPLVAGRVGLKLEVRLDASGLTSTLREPDPTLLRSLLPTVRKFLLAGDDHQLTGVHNLAIRHIDDPELVHAIESAKYGYRLQRDGLGLQVHIDGSRMTAERAADLWINGVYLHSDADKERELRSLTGIAPNLVRHAFLDFVFELTKNAIWTGSVLAAALDRRVVLADPVAVARVHPHARNPGAVLADTSPLPTGLSSITFVDEGYQARD